MSFRDYLARKRHLFEFTFPFILRKTHEKEIDKRIASEGRRAAGRAERRYAQYVDDYDRTVRPILQSLSKLESMSRIDMRDALQINYVIDRHVLEQLAMDERHYGDDNRYWEHVAGIIARHVERELRGMKFARFRHEAAEDTNRRHVGSLADEL